MVVTGKEVAYPGGAMASDVLVGTLVLETTVQFFHSRLI